MNSLSPVIQEQGKEVAHSYSPCNGRMGHQGQQQNNNLIAKIVCEKKFPIVAKKKKP
jgi:hypothetical protein